MSERWHLLQHNGVRLLAAATQRRGLARLHNETPEGCHAAAHKSGRLRRSDTDCRSATRTARASVATFPSRTRLHEADTNEEARARHSTERDTSATPRVSQAGGAKPDRFDHVRVHSVIRGQSSSKQRGSAARALCERSAARGLARADNARPTAASFRQLQGRWAERNRVCRVCRVSRLSVDRCSLRRQLGPALPATRDWCSLP